MEIIILDGTKITSMEEAHRYLAQMLHFPAYYGKNLDALADCLSELSRHTYVFLINGSALRQQLGEQAKKLLAVFEEISAEENTFHWIEEE